MVGCDAKCELRKLRLASASRSTRDKEIIIYWIRIVIKTHRVGCIARLRASMAPWELENNHGAATRETVERERIEWSLADLIICGSEFVRREWPIAADKLRNAYWACRERGRVLCSDGLLARCRDVLARVNRLEHGRDLSHLGRGHVAEDVRAAELVEAVEETLSYYAFPEEHWRRIRTNNRAAFKVFQSTGFRYRRLR